MTFCSYRNAVLFFILFLPLVSGCATRRGESPAGPSNDEERKVRLIKPVKAAILDFENQTKYGERRLADSAGEILATEMLHTGNYILVERQRLDEVLQELELQLSGLTENDAAEVGAILECDYLLSGVISDFGVKTEGKDMLIIKEKVQKAHVEVDVRIIDVTTAEVVYSAYGEGTAEKKIKSTLGMGTTGGYDETLAGESLRMAIQDSVRDMNLFFKAREGV